MGAWLLFVEISVDYIWASVMARLWTTITFEPFIDYEAAALFFRYAPLVVLR